MVAGINSSEIKLHNLSAILLTLLHNDNISRVHLSQSIGVSTATITNLVSELVAQGFIVEEGLVRTDGHTNVGRPQKALRLVPNSRYVIGVHIDVGKIYVSLANIQGKLVHSQHFEHSMDVSWHTVMNHIVDAIKDIIAKQYIPKQEILGVGVAASGLVDPNTGVNAISPNLDWHDVPIQDYLSGKLDLPIVVENNVRAMALGEAMFGSGININAMAFVYARIGVGAGLVVDGKIYRGAGAGAGEIGHTTIIHERCDNGKTILYTLEDIISRPAIIKAAKEIARNNPTSLLAQYTADIPLEIDTIFEAAQNGDQAIKEMLEHRAYYMGIALANLINIFNPEMIVLGGIFTHERNLLLPTITQTIRKYAFANLGTNVEIKVTEFGHSAGMIGAAALALDHFFYRPQPQLTK